MSNNIYEHFKDVVSNSKEILLTDEEIAQLEPFFDNLSERLGEEKTHDFRFTELQKKAISTPEFWKADMNKLILGATSSGKTLVSELNMAYRIYCKEEQVLYLVPLKVLTTEKQDHFLQDFKEKRVYISSSDYQEQDYVLGKGDYDIGILVYEKFFALLAENSENFLKNCRLIVVDEMHMLSAQERGPKLEFSLEKVRFNKKKHAAILGLTTSESDISRVYEWLGQDKTSIIESDNRPIDIEERFVYCDSLTENIIMKCFVNGEEQEAPVFSVTPRYNEHDSQLFQLFQIIEKHPEDNIIIFCNSKRKSVMIVNELCSSGILKKKYVKAEDFPDIVDTDLEQSNYDLFKNHLEQYSIAYHNASLTLGMREYIESQFRNEKIRVLVATETLTMGVNTPTDIMILYDNTVYRGSEKPEPMKYHDYKNAIGRAGRLGISKGNKGISYMLIGKEQSQLDKKVNLYVRKQEKLLITSSVSNLYEKLAEYYNKITLPMVIAPFYLNLLNARDFTEDEISNLLKNGLGNYSDQSGSLSDEIIEVLQGNNNNNKLSMPKFASKTIGFQELEDDSDFYEITEFGKKMASFALSIGTYQTINSLFYQAETPKNEKYHLPVYNPEDPFTLEPDKFSNDNKHQKMYFIDVMFNVCNLPEIKHNRNYLNVPKLTSLNPLDSERRENIQKMVLAFFRKKVTSNMLWDKSQLKSFCDPETNEVTGEAPLLCLYRTIVLYYWVQGYDVRDIRRELELPNREEYYIYTSEVESLGELCAYQLEAISRIVKNNSTSNYDEPSINKELQRMFYALSIRIKYGMSNDLARIANKHIRGINRARLLKIEKEAKNKKDHYPNVTYYILNNDIGMKKLGVTDKQLEKLRSVLRNVLKFQEDQLEDSVRRTALVNEDFWDKYRTIKSMGNDALDALGRLFSNYLDVHFKEENGTLPCYGIVRSENLAIYLCSKHDYNSSEEIINECENENKFDGKVLYIYKNGDLSDKETAVNCMQIGEFCTYLLKCIAFGNSNDLENAGRHFINLLLKYIDGTKISDLDKLDAALSSQNINDEQLSKVHKTVNNVVIINNTNIQANSVNQYIQFNVNDCYVAINKLRDEYSNSSEEENQFFEKAVETIDKQLLETNKTDIASECRLAMKDENPDYDLLMNEIRNLSDLTKYMQQAIYVKSKIESLGELEDFSPAAVLYGKALEVCLYERFRPILLDKAPDIKIMKRSLDDSHLQWTLGSYTQVLKDEFCQNSKSAKYGFYNNMNLEQRNNWKGFYDLVNECKNIRNDSSHKGTTISLKQIDKLHDTSKKIIIESNKLEDWKKELV